MKTPPQAASLQRFSYNAPSAPSAVLRSGKATEKPRPSKRRTLPWLEAHADEEKVLMDPTPNPNGKHSKSDAFTPLPNSTKKEAFPWNTTASAIKQQQRNLREVNKKLTKNHGPTEDGLARAISTRKKNTVHRVFLSEEQQHVLDLVVQQKKSVFFTGSAGTGKSVLLREIISALRKKFVREPDRVAVTASTGLAACNIGGTTLHSFAGIGLGKENVQELIKKVKKSQKNRHRWMRTK
ncbi:hypothetical protein LTS18_001730, partial [Coniosporium uncinatum]